MKPDVMDCSVVVNPVAAALYVHQRFWISSPPLLPSARRVGGQTANPAFAPFPLVDSGEIRCQKERLHQNCLGDQGASQIRNAAHESSDRSEGVCGSFRSSDGHSLLLFNTP
jgi:hypothetical protein